MVEIRCNACGQLKPTRQFSFSAVPIYLEPHLPSSKQHPRYTGHLLQRISRETDLCHDCLGLVLRFLDGKDREVVPGEMSRYAKRKWEQAKAQQKQLPLDEDPQAPSAWPPVMLKGDRK